MHVSDPTVSAAPSKRILVINDDPVILGVFKEPLEEDGYGVAIFTLRTGNPDEQFHHILEERQDAVALDFLILGEQLGWQFLQLVKMRPQTATVPVVVCTAAADLVRELGAHLAKMKVEVVLEPFEIDDLYAAIARDLESAGDDPWHPKTTT